jgi:HK97 family phage portal protein
MNFWETMWSPIRSWFGGRQNSGTQLTGPGSYASRSAVSVTEETALQVSAVWACVRLISQTVASLPLVVYRKTDGGREVDPGHWFAKLMNGKPNRYQTRYEFWEHQIANLTLHGNFYCQKIIIGGRVRALLPLNPLQVEVRLVGGKVVYLFTADGGVTALSAESVWHVRTNADLIVGRSPLHFGRNIIGVAQAAEDCVANIYRNGGKPSGVLSMDKLLTKEQREQIRASFDSLTTGTDERLLVLEMGAKFEAVSMSPEDIEMLASRKYQVDEIARWFGVPSILINQNEGSTTLGSSTAEIIAAFYKLKLRSDLEAVECSIVTHLFSDEDRALHEVEFDFEGLLRADQKSRYDGYRTGITAGVITPNEARRMEWLPDVEGGNQLFMQGAMVPIEMLGKAPPTAPTPISPEGTPDGT